jgi:uncharacterized membrane protein
MPEEDTKIKILDTLRNERTEKIFYITLLVTVMHGGLVLWDLFCLIIKKENGVFSSSTFSNVYLLFLGAYAGYKEFVRWMESSSTEDEDVSKQNIIRIRRGEYIAFTWIVLLIVCLMLKSLLLIPRLPYELERTAIQVFSVVIGTFASRSLFIRRAKKRVESGIPAESNIDFIEAEKRILAYVAERGSIDNEEVRKITGFARGMAYKTLERLESEKKLKAEGTGKSIKYVKAV